MFDSGKKGLVDTDRIRTILNTLGQNFDEDELNELIDAHDVEGKFLSFQVKEILCSSGLLIGILFECGILFEFQPRRA